MFSFISLGMMLSVSRKASCISASSFPAKKSWGRGAKYSLPLFICLFVYNRIAVFSVTVFYDERIVVVAEQRPDASEEDSFQWMSRVLQVRTAWTSLAHISKCVGSL